MDGGSLAPLGGFVFVSLCYLVRRCVLQLAALHFRSIDFTELEIVELRHELGVLRRQRRRPVMTETDRLFLAAASRQGSRRNGSHLRERRSACALIDGPLSPSRAHRVCAWCPLSAGPEQTGQL